MKKMLSAIYFSKFAARTATCWKFFPKSPMIALSVLLFFLGVLSTPIVGAAEDHPDTSPANAAESRATKSADPFEKSPDAGQSEIVKLRPLRCPTPANPYKRTQECWDEPFDMNEDTMFGDWHGERKKLQGFGITPIMSYLTNIMGNTSGASSSRVVYAGQVNASVTLDYEKLLRIPGLSMVATGSWGTGGGLTSHLGNLFNVMNADEGAGIWLAQIYFQEKLFNNTLTIAAGRMGQADIFACIPIFGNYINAGFNGNPASLLINHPSFAEPPPGTEWGAQATYNFSPHWQTSVGVYNTNLNSAAATERGVDLAFQQGNKGVMSLGQISYMHNQGSGDKGMQGMYTLGGLYDGTRYTSLSTGDTTTGNWDLYAMFQQMVYTDGGPESQKGLTVWAQITYTWKQELNRMPLFMGAGLSYQGIIPGRSDDIASLGWLYGKISKFVPSTTAEQVYEANYQITLINWLNITPDFQYVLHPSGFVGQSGLKNSTVFGAQLSVTF